ncbi:MAG: XRE family transcriptional regulator [Bacteroidetes bacterium]|nr:MAG: XRE family transcriptional regulator [Bacteroidota bacterium]
MENGNINLQVGNNIRSRRELQNLSQEELAFRAGLHRAYIGQIERGEKNIGIQNLEKIAIALKISIKDLFD